MESLLEYKAKIKKVTEPRHHKIKGSYGVLDAYRWYMKKCNAQKKKYLTSTEYYKIIRGVNKALGEYIVEGEIIKLPLRMGEIFVCIYDATPRIKLDGTLKINYPVNWNKTLELWYEDEEAKEDNILVRETSKEWHKIMYSKRLARFENLSYYRFKPVRILTNQLNQKKQEGTLSGFTFNKLNYG